MPHHSAAKNGCTRLSAAGAKKQASTKHSKVDQRRRRRSQEASRRLRTQEDTLYLASLGRLIGGSDIKERRREADRRDGGIVCRRQRHVGHGFLLNSWGLCIIFDREISLCAREAISRRPLESWRTLAR